MKERKKYVWIVVAGEDYEGYNIDSVHKSKCRAVKRLKELDDDFPSLHCAYIMIEKHEIK